MIEFHPGDIAGELPNPTSMSIDYKHERHQLFLAIGLARHHKGMTQAQLAEKTGIPQSAIARIETGKANPTVDTLLRLAEALRLRLEVHP